MSSGAQHTVRSHDHELEKLDAAIERISGLARRQLADALQALETGDTDIAARVLQGDRAIDECERFIDDQVVRVLALHAPVADDLRRVVTALKVAGDIERIGDHAANTAKRVLVLSQSSALAPTRGLLRLGQAVAELLGEALDAYLAGDAAQALAVRDGDQAIDDLYSSLFREIITYMMEDPRTITACSHLMFIAKNIERVGDHATNIAEMTVYLVTGQAPDSQRPKRDVSTSEGGQA